MEQTFFQKLLKSPVTFICGATLFGMVVYQFWGMTTRFYALYQEKRESDRHIAEIRKKNEAVQKEIDYTETDGFLEREGKSRLNLKKPGEEVVVIVQEKEDFENQVLQKRTLWQKMVGTVSSYFGF